MATEWWSVGWSQTSRASSATTTAFVSDSQEIKVSTRTKPRPPEQRRNSQLIQLYGLTLVDWAEMLEKQKGLCAAGCGALATQVDHCHQCQHIDKRGSVRGLLCARCNRSLNHIAQFSSEHAAYLAVHAAVCPALDEQMVC